MSENLGSGNIKLLSSSSYTDDYKQQVFQIWYNNGKPTLTDLRNLIPIPETNFNQKPSTNTLNNWVKNDFQERAKVLDAGVRETMNNALVASKVEMLQRHMDISKRMQSLAVDYLETHADEMTSSTAVRLLVESVRMERESIGIPGMLEKMSKKTDEELLEEVRKLVEESPIDFEQEDEEDG